MMSFSSLFSKETVFIRYFLAFIIWELASWALPVAVPLLVAEKYGVGAELAFSIGMQWLPSIFLGPFIGALINRTGPRKMTIYIMLSFSALLVWFPVAETLWQIQLMVLIMGMLSIIGTPAILTLRSIAIPKGREVDGNALIQGVDRLAKIVSPLLVTFFMLSVGLSGEFFIAAIFCLFSAILLRTIPEMEKEMEKGGSNPKETTVCVRRRENTQGFLCFHPEQAGGYRVDRNRYGLHDYVRRDQDLSIGCRRQDR
jgi:MFS family permease